MPKGQWEQPNLKQETKTDLGPEEKQEVQSALKRLADLLEKPEVAKYVRAVLLGPQQLIAEVVDKLIPAQRPPKIPNEGPANESDK